VERQSKIVDNLQWQQVAKIIEQQQALADDIRMISKSKEMKGVKKMGEEKKRLHTINESRKVQVGEHVEENDESEEGDGDRTYIK